jgi:hypothetical protein
VADINVERKGPSIWPWIIGLIVLALLIWALTELFDDDADDLVTEPIADDAAQVEPGPEPMDADAMLVVFPVGEIVADPAAFAGRRLSGEVRVTDVPTDRGFWIEQDGQRLFAILRDQPAEEPVDINPGQTLRISDATVLTATGIAPITGELDADTRGIVEGEDVVLSIDESNIEIVSRTGRQPAAGSEQPL